MLTIPNINKYRKLLKEAYGDKYKDAIHLVVKYFYTGDVKELVELGKLHPDQTVSNSIKQMIINDYIDNLKYSLR